MVRRSPRSSPRGNNQAQEVQEEGNSGEGTSENNTRLLETISTLITTLADRIPIQGAQPSRHSRTAARVITNGLERYPAITMRGDKDRRDPAAVAKWLREWQRLIGETDLDDEQKLQTTHSKLDSTLSKILTDAEIQAKTQAVLMAQQDLEESSEVDNIDIDSAQYPIPAGWAYITNYVQVMTAFKKSILRDIGAGVFEDQLEALHLGEQLIQVHEQTFANTVDDVVTAGGINNQRTFCRAYIRSLGRQYIDEMSSTTEFNDLGDAFRWARQTNKIFVNRRKYAPKSKTIAALVPGTAKHLLPTRQTQESTKTTTTSIEYSTASREELIKALEARKTLDKESEQGADSDSDEEPVPIQNKRRKSNRKSNLVATIVEEVIAALPKVIAAERAQNPPGKPQHEDKKVRFQNPNNSLRLVNGTAWDHHNRRYMVECSYCKNRHKLNEQGERETSKQKWKNPAPETIYVGHNFRNCDDRKRQTQGTWCGFCPSLQHNIENCSRFQTFKDQPPTPFRRGERNSQR